MCEGVCPGQTSACLDRPAGCDQCSQLLITGLTLELAGVMAAARRSSVRCFAEPTWKHTHGHKVHQVYLHRRVLMSSPVPSSLSLAGSLSSPAPARYPLPAARYSFPQPTPIFSPSFPSSGAHSIVAAFSTYTHILLALSRPLTCFLPSLAPQRRLTYGRKRDGHDIHIHIRSSYLIIIVLSRTTATVSLSTAGCHGGSCRVRERSSVCSHIRYSCALHSTFSLESNESLKTLKTS